MNEIFVDTGRVIKGRKKSILRINALGSCIAVIGCNYETGTGGAAHIMLPGKAPVKSKEKTKYAYNSIKKLLKLLGPCERNYDCIRVLLIGGANVLKRPDCTIAQDNLKSVKEELEKYKVVILAESVGGTERRKAVFNISTGEIFCSKGSGREKKLFTLKEMI